MRAELTIAQSTDLHDGGGATKHVPWTSFYRSPLNDRIATQIYANQAVGVLERWLLSLLDAAVFVHFAIVIPALHSRPSERNQI